MKSPYEILDLQTKLVSKLYDWFLSKNFTIPWLSMQNYILTYLYMPTLKAVPQIHTRDPRPPILPRVMALSVMGLNLGSVGFCRTHMQEQTQNECVHDLLAPCSVLRMFVFMFGQQHVQVTCTPDKPRFF